MKMSFDLKTFNPIQRILEKFHILLWAFLGIVFVAVAWVIFGEVAKITQSQTDLSSANNKIVRVNQEKYAELEKRLNDDASFSPQEIRGVEAFLPVDPPEEED